MDEEIERLIVSVRADTAAFAGDVADMRGTLEGAIGAGAERAGRAIESGLTRAVRTGSFGFEELRRVAIGVLNDIAGAALRGGIGAVSGGQGGGLIAIGTQLLGGLIGAPGRATGGPVAPGRAFMVGERGPELFVPTAAGRVEPIARGGGRDVRIAVTINAPGGGEARALERSGRQVARAVRAALERAGD